MTIGGWIVCVMSVALIMVLFGGLAYLSESNGARIFWIGAGIMISVAVIIIMLFYYNFTASGKRAYKTQKSELQNGIDRTVTVYDMEGDIIKTYSGKFDVTYDSDRILFDDEQGKRHVIYYPTGTVTVDEN